MGWHSLASTHITRNHRKTPKRAKKKNPKGLHSLRKLTTHTPHTHYSTHPCIFPTHYPPTPVYSHSRGPNKKVPQRIPCYLARYTFSGGVSLFYHLAHNVSEQLDRALFLAGSSSAFWFCLLGTWRCIAWLTWGVERISNLQNAGLWRDCCCLWYGTERNGTVRLYATAREREDREASS